jgi:hypothetical protein
MPTPEKFIIPDSDIAPLAVTIENAAKLTGESRSQVYNRMGRGEYTAIKAGRRTLILYESIKAHIAGLPRATIKAPKPRPKRELLARRGRKPVGASTTTSES